MIITYKRKLKLNKTQERHINNWIGTCRFIYNLALETRIEAWKKGISVHKYDLCKQLTPLRADINWIKDVPVHTLQGVIDKLDRSYKSFFNGGGFPKWASRKKFRSVSFKEVLKTDGNKVKLPKIGWLKTFKDQPIEGKIKTATITREHDGYYISITSEIEQLPIQPVSESQAIGLDMGLAHFATTSDGEYISNPRIFSRYEKQLRIEQRSLSRKKKGSNNRDKQKLILTKLHSKIKRSRKDFLDKNSWRIVRDSGFISVEDLKVKDMLKKHLSKHILDAGWGEFRRQLEYKSELYGRKFTKVDPAYTSQTCSDCGTIDKSSRQSQSKFVCTSCGVEQNADVNAAKNILARALASVPERKAAA